jgi:hypothetical protein
MARAPWMKSTACRRTLHSLRNRVGVPEVILVASPKRLRKSRRHLFDRMTERKQFTAHIVSGHASFDPD